MKKVVSLFLVLVMVFSLAACGNSNDGASGETGSSTTEDATETNTDDSSTEDTSTSSDVKITFLNTKGEIQAQLEDVAKVFQADTGIELEIIPTGAGTSPFEKMSALYASGNAPTISMMDAGDLEKFEDKMLDLTGEKWIDDAMPGSLDVARINDKLLAFPFAVEGFGLIYNKTAIESATGEAFDPDAIQSREDLETLFQDIEAGGIAPIVISPLDWSLGAHYTQIAFSQRGGNIAGHNEIMDKLKTGELTFSEFDAFNSLMDTFDILARYNMDKSDPLSGTYDTGAEAVATGSAAFWFMGNWAWPQINEMSGDNKEFGFLPVPLDMEGEDNKISAGPTKYVALDQEQSTPEQQEAAKQFLNWIVYEENGQKGLVETCSIIPAFLNIDKTPDDALAKSVLDYMSEGRTYAMVLTFPADYWAEVGASFQKHLAGLTTREEFYEEMENYWEIQQ
jgi:raffinose/stachyose/melibiose transport system substrate-binding protein